MDAITIQILRNKVASLVDEMHYHFYRSGYSTIIRESRDFSCVILDREGRLIVAPPMFFHAPVYRHLVGRILKLYGGNEAIKDGDVFVRGTCTGVTTSKLKLSEEDGRIEVEFEVDQNRSGVRWNVSLFQNGRSYSVMSWSPVCAFGLASISTRSL